MFFFLVLFFFLFCAVRKLMQKKLNEPKIKQRMCVLWMIIKIKDGKIIKCGKKTNTKDANEMINEQMNGKGEWKERKENKMNVQWWFCAGAMRIGLPPCTRSVWLSFVVVVNAKFHCWRRHTFKCCYCCFVSYLQHL